MSRSPLLPPARVELEAFLPEIMAFAHETETHAGLPDAAALAFIRNAACDLSRRSNAYRRELWIDAQKDVTDYPIQDGCDVFLSALWVEINGQRAIPSPGRPCSCGGRLFQIIDGMIHISWNPDEDTADAILIRAALSPTADACDLDRDFFFDRYRQVVIDGALAKILLLPNMPWTNISLARVLQTDFERGCGEARRNAMMGESAGPVYATSRPFVSCRRFR